METLGHSIVVDLDSAVTFNQFYHQAIINSTFKFKAIRLKGILHPQMKLLSSFTHPQVVATLYEFLSSAEHKGRYFEERLERNSCLVPLTSIVETHTGLKLLEGE